uniref:Cytochrome b6-f complex subunit PetP n=1 Tax=Kuetzingia canaliculata TaxID=228262 RepID=A0A1Z1MPX3_KUECA|nr:cytochrome b6-f complex subunit PetP [Kuetzingia canaliculata]ARW67902.1 cytochrome b6-f complex subunit PetP [Kuetzingia canaliculata]
MQKRLINIKLIPINIKNKILPYIYQQLHIVGYKTLINKYKVPIIQLKNEARIWILQHETR